MLSIALLAIALFALSSLVVVIAARRAPVGYQDSEGFSFGVEHADTRCGRAKRNHHARHVEVCAPAGSRSANRSREMTLVM
ncbi:MAG: hypothetical protein KBA71_06170 [Opitutaceae bacterium]|nr:hypothetical protein [Opitutaceae bacterium]